MPVTIQPCLPGLIEHKHILALRNLQSHYSYYLLSLFANEFKKPQEHPVVEQTVCNI